jgi:hypothetical protein
MQSRIAAILLADSATIPETWLLRPNFLLWPPKRHKAVLWMLAHLAVFRTQDDLSEHDNIDFLRRARWKLNSTQARQRLVVNDLIIVD